MTLIALNGQEKGREFQLSGEEPTLIGRQAAMLQLIDSQTSRRHAEISLQNNTWLIRDLGSTNGTWVNGQKITQLTELETGDRIVFGRHQFRVGPITDDLAPTPQPRPNAPEPAIGSEDLAEMGVDLGESLSADILDDEAPEAPAPPLDEPSEAPANTPPTAKSSSDELDDVIDLDAVLDEQEPQADTGLDLPADSAADLEDVTPETAEPTQTTHELTKPDENPPATHTQDDGVLDLDAMLEPEPTDQSDPVTAPEQDADAPDRADRDEPSSDDAQGLAPDRPDEQSDKASESDDDSLIDIDILAAAEPTSSATSDNAQLDEDPRETEAPDERDDSPATSTDAQPPPELDINPDAEITGDSDDSDSIDDIDDLLDDNLNDFDDELSADESAKAGGRSANSSETRRTTPRCPKAPGR